MFLRRMRAISVAAMVAGIAPVFPAAAVPIVETFESFATGTAITTQITGLTVSAPGGTAKIATATSPVIPGEPQGLYNDKPGSFSTGFEFPLVIDFAGTAISVGAFVDFGVVGDGLKLSIYDGLGGTGTLLGTAATSAEVFLGLSATGIKSAVFEKVSGVSTSWLIDNLTYELAAVPEPASLALLGIALAGFAVARRRPRSPGC